MARTPNEELVHVLSDMYSVEQQALAQLVTAPDLARDPALALIFRTHLEETREQAAQVEQRLKSLGGSPSTVKDAVMKLGGKGFLLFARAMGETPGRLVVHAYSYEAMEWAGYEVLIGIAQRVNDPGTEEVATSIQRQEAIMMSRLEQGFDAAEQVSHEGKSAEDMGREVRKHLAEMRALESQSMTLLERAPSLLRDPTLNSICEDHLRETREQAERLDARLKAMKDSTSIVEDTALTVGGFTWSVFFQMQGDTAAKYFAFLYAVEHLEVAGYELLKRTAVRAGDRQTEDLCRSILAEERAAAGKIRDRLQRAVDLTLTELQPR